MKKNMFNSFLFVVFGILFFASNVIRAYGTLAIVAEMPDQISEEIKGTGAHSGKGAGSAAHIRNIIHGDKNFPQKFFTIEAEKTPHITLAIIGTLNHNNTKVTEGVTFKYGFKPHVTLAAVSSSSLGIENLKKADNNPRSRLFRKFSDVASTTEKAHKKGSRYKSMKIDEILLSFDRNMKNTTAYRLR